MSKDNAVVVKTDSVLKEYTDEQVHLLKTHIAKGTDNDQLIYFLQVAKARNLNPFAGQIFCVVRTVKNGDKYEKVIAIQTGIDGFRTIASRTGELAGVDDIEYDREVGTPTWAKATVYRTMKNGAIAKFTAKVRWSEFFPGEKMGFMWKQKPFHMLGKCALAQAYRTGFPEELGGIYEEAELEMDNYVPSETTNADKLKDKVLADKKKETIEIKTEPKGEDQVAKLKKLLKAKGKTVKEVEEFFGDKLENVEEAKLKRTIARLEALPDQEAPKAEPVKTEPVKAEVVKEEPAPIKEEVPLPKEEEVSVLDMMDDIFGDDLIKE